MLSVSSYLTNEKTSPSLLISVDLFMSIWELTHSYGDMTGIIKVNQKGEINFTFIHRLVMWNHSIPVINMFNIWPPLR